LLKVIIAGTRTFKDYELVKKTCDHMFSKQTPYIEIVNGGANGADRLGGRYAMEMGYKNTLFQANWDEFGKSAGYIRNKEMAEYADAAIIFWDGTSKGAKHMIDLAVEANLKLKIVTY
tara:strand:+ start:93 stop:446 length:354 start_codon:yes stop_codon:yes gene_type:complete